MTKFKNILTRLFWSENNDNMGLTTDDEAAFNVNLGKLIIGTLTFSEGIWTFGYSDDFKLQNTISPLVNFPSKEKKYTTRELWPFFASRIPSSAQRQLGKTTIKENPISLLKQFGKRTVANPYELRFV